MARRINKNSRQMAYGHNNANDDNIESEEPKIQKYFTIICHTWNRSQNRSCRDNDPPNCISLDDIPVIRFSGCRFCFWLLLFLSRINVNNSNLNSNSNNNNCRKSSNNTSIRKPQETRHGRQDEVLIMWIYMPEQTYM